MKLKLDENLSCHLKPALAAMQHDVATAADEGLLAHPDTEVAAAAREEQRMLLTLDVDFADIREFPPGSHPGIVVFRPPALGPLAVNRFVEQFVRDADLRSFAGCLAVVEVGRVRVRRPQPEGG